MGFFEFFGGLVIFGVLLVFVPRTSFLVVLMLYLMHLSVPLFENDLVGGWPGASATVIFVLATIICFVLEMSSSIKWLQSKMG